MDEEAIMEEGELIVWAVFAAYKRAQEITIEFSGKLVKGEISWKTLVRRYCKKKGYYAPIMIKWLIDLGNGKIK